MYLSSKQTQIGVLLLLAGFLTASAADGYGSEYADKATHYKPHQQHEDMDYDKLPRKAAFLRDTIKSDKSAVLLVTLTLDKSTQSCPSKHRDMDYMRQYVADSFDVMLRRAHVDAHIKTGILGCKAFTEDDCVKVVLTFAVKLHSKKGSELLPKFIEVVTMSRYNHRELCSIPELNCQAQRVAAVEVEQLPKRPKGTKMIKYDPDVEDTTGDDEHDGKAHTGHSTWAHAKYDEKKKGDHEAGDHKGAAFAHEIGDDEESDDDADDNYGANGDEQDGGNAAGGYGQVGGYGLRASMIAKAHVAANAATTEPRSKFDTRLWPEEAFPVAPIAAKAAAAKDAIAAARTAAAAVPVSHHQLKTATFDTRLWPDTLIMPWQKLAAPVV